MFTLLALAPTVLTLLAVLCTLACMPLYWATLERPCPQDTPTDWDALEVELDVDAGWEAVYTDVMGCNRPIRCRIKQQRHGAVSMSEGVRRCSQMSSGHTHRDSAQRNPGQRGPPPPGAGDSG